MSNRIDALRSGLGEIGCDAYFSVAPPTNQYLSGLLTHFMEISSVIVITADEALFLCDFRYTEQAKSQVQGFEIREIKGNQLTRGAELLEELGVKKVAYDPGELTVAHFDLLQKAYTGELLPHATLISDLRVRKSPEEIDTIRAASQLAEGVLEDLIPTLREGIPERELAATFEFEFKKRGATAPSFDTIALFGARSSLPHGEPGDKRLERGDTVLLDFGCRKEGYCSDLTRTFAFGTIPGAWFEEIYAIVLNAQVSALQAVRPGASARQVDAVARDIITDAGYGDYFGHGLGHGVGIEIHEAPRLNTESDVTLEEGMVVTVEPGIYLPDRGGVRIEDLVVVTAEGCEVLTRSSKELRILNG
ncbi:MAG: aminopeptidase P family protein [Candidatus Hydrogenedentes bacterium]|nr:aminopeptidase P family protein [Candidatus Hydrogenedentota bacterium]